MTITVTSMEGRPVSPLIEGTAEDMDESARKLAAKPFCVLYINRSDSKCGACGQGANPYEVIHESYYGYGNQLKGCGAWFTHVSSNYKGMKSDVTDMRPDLPWFGTK